MKEREKSRKKIAFFGIFGSNNFGNESTLKAILYNIRRYYPDAEVVCITTRPDVTAANHQVEAIPISENFLNSLRPRNPLLRIGRRLFIGVPIELKRWVDGIVNLWRTDMLIIPGTGLLTDAWGLRGFGPYNMFKWSLMAKICRCKLLFVSVGAGPIYSALGRFFVKSALSLADYRSYRDNTTKQYLKGIGFSADKDPICPDLVFSLPQTSIPHQHHTKKHRRTVVGLGLMCYTGKYSTPRPSNEIYLAYLENLANFASWLLARQSDVRLLIGDLEDINTTREFKSVMRKKISVFDEKHIIDEPVSSIEALLTQIASTDIVVATRFHNVLLALLCEKPVISISFHHKCDSLMNAMGLSAYSLNINTLDSNRLIDQFCHLQANADKVRPLIREMAKEFRGVLDEQYGTIFNGPLFLSGINLKSGDWKKLLA